MARLLKIKKALRAILNDATASTFWSFPLLSNRIPATYRSNFPERHALPLKQLQV
jgi:hypothetical protein